MRARGWGLLIWGFVVTGVAFAQPVLRSDQIRRVEAIFAPWDRTDSPGLGLAIVWEGRIRYWRGFGMADLEHRVPITDSTRFVLASVSKQFTAFAVHLLAAEGRLDLDGDVRQYIPELAHLKARITVRHLLHHTSGLRESLDLARLAGWRPEDVLTMSDVLRLAYGQRELNFEPGTAYAYCNLGYVLLAELVRRVSGQSLGVFARKRIFEPLDMRDTFFHEDYRMITPNRAQSYARTQDGWVKVHYPYGTVGSGGLVSTLRDLAKWDENFYTHTVGGAKLLQALQERGRLADGRELNYASGLMIGSYRGLVAVWHTGSIAGYRAILFRLPEARFSVIILANASNVNTLALAHQVADIVLEDRFPQPARAEAAEEPSVRPPRTVSRPSREQLRAYEGFYYSPELEVFYRIALVGDSLRLRHPKEEWTLLPLEEDVFQLPVGRVEFLRDPQGRVLEMRLSTGRTRNLRFLRAEVRYGLSSGSGGA
ncbi:MAG: beta-lactamase family protein [Bacteroidetes bacterium]|nr:beta-lactamase family protein [Bacteroidota bacterium]